ncbi:hypothetical protein U1Q18_011575 [Sarracenia purpurea var. burkii]
MGNKESENMAIEKVGSYGVLPLLSLNHISLLNQFVDDDTMNEPRLINPKDNHISFQCTDVGLLKRRLKNMGMRYVTAAVEGGGIKMDQVFFHDPDGYMIEICNCENLPALPMPSCLVKPKDENYKNMEATRCGLIETLMMESLSLDMMNFSF